MPIGFKGAAVASALGQLWNGRDDGSQCRCAIGLHHDRIADARCSTVRGRVSQNEWLRPPHRGQLHRYDVHRIGHVSLQVKKSQISMDRFFT